MNELAMQMKALEANGITIRTKREAELELDLAATKERLQKAEEVVKFYAHKDNWSSEGFNVDDDIEWLPNGKNSQDLWDNVDNHGGKRARQYMQTYGTSGDVPTGEKK